MTFHRLANPIRQPNHVVNRVLRSDWDPTGHSDSQRLVMWSIWSLSTHLLLSGEEKPCQYSPGFHINRVSINVSVMTGHFVNLVTYILANQNPVNIAQGFMLIGVVSMPL